MNRREGQKPTQLGSNMTHEETDTKTAFALLLETASQEFKILQALIQGELLVVSRMQLGAANANNFDGHRAQSSIQMALAKEFLFNTVRAFRICERAADELAIDRKVRKSFIKLVRPSVAVRDVNEHGFDPKGGARGKSSRPSMCHHASDSVVCDETSLVILGPNRILMGPLNLWEVFEQIEAMRQTAGFSSLHL